MDKKSPILVTGATGFVGSYILRTLVASGYLNLSALRRPKSRMDLVKEIENEVNWIEIDLLDSWSIHEVLKGFKGVIHAGAMVSFSRRDRNLMMKVNTEGTANIVNGCLENDVEKLVHVSSIAVFSRKAGKQLINEETPWDHNANNTHYAISKYHAEMEVWRGGSEGLGMAIINPSMILGSGFWEGTSVALFKTVYKTLPFYPGGVNGFVDVRDVASAAIKLLTNDVVNRRYIISGGNYSYRDILGTIATKLNRKAPTIKLTKAVREMAILQSWLRSIFDRDHNAVTREALRNASGNFHFDATRSILDLDMQYRNVELTIAETAAQLLVSAKNGFTPSYLQL